MAVATVLKDLDGVNWRETQCCTEFYEFSTAGKSLSDVVAINFYNRAAATFFKDITTTGALLTLMVYGSGGVAANLDEAEAAYRRRPRRLFAGFML